MLKQVSQLLIAFKKHLISQGKQLATISSYKTDTVGFFEFLIENKINYQLNIKLKHLHWQVLFFIKKAYRFV